MSEAVPLLYFPYREILRSLTFEILIVELYFLQLAVNVAIRNDNFCALNDFLFVIGGVKQYGNVCFKGNIIKAEFPFGVQ